MTKRIFKSIFLTALLVLLFSFVLIFAVLYSYSSDLSERQLKNELAFAARGVELQGTDYFENLDAGGVRITWISADGTVLYDSSDADTAKMENHLERSEVQEALKSGYGSSRRFSSTLMERSLYAAMLLADGTVLRMSVSQMSVLNLIMGMGPAIAAVILFAVLFSFFIATRLSKRIVSPLNEIDLEHPSVKAGYEELAPLLDRIEAQQIELRDQKIELEKERNTVHQAEIMRREFTANVSHELKTPLHSISGCAELMKDGVVKEEDVRPFAGKIYNEARRTIALVEDIISLSHLDEGAGDMTWEKTDLLETAKTVAKRLEAKADENGISVSVDGEHTLLKGIPSLIETTVYNLADNAVKYNRPGGHVWITADTAGGNAVLAVRDDGIGIPEKDQGRVFERFFRVDKSHSREIGGTGLGLSIVKHAVMIHHGKIELSSTPGQGTTITVTLPAGM